MEDATDPNNKGEENHVIEATNETSSDAPVYDLLHPVTEPQAFEVGGCQRPFVQAYQNAYDGQGILQEASPALGAYAQFSGSGRDPYSGNPSPQDAVAFPSFDVQQLTDNKADGGLQVEKMADSPQFYLTLQNSLLAGKSGAVDCTEARASDRLYFSGCTAATPVVEAHVKTESVDDRSRLPQMTWFDRIGVGGLNIAAAGATQTFTGLDTVSAHYEPKPTPAPYQGEHVVTNALDQLQNTQPSLPSVVSTFSKLPGNEWTTASGGISRYSNCDYGCYGYDMADTGGWLGTTYDMAHSERLLPLRDTAQSYTFTPPPPQPGYSVHSEVYSDKQYREASYLLPALNNGSTSGCNATVWQKVKKYEKLNTKGEDRTKAAAKSSNSGDPRQSKISLSVQLKSDPSLHPGKMTPESVCVNGTVKLVTVSADPSNRSPRFATGSLSTTDGVERDEIRNLIQPLLPSEDKIRYHNREYYGMPVNFSVETKADQPGQMRYTFTTASARYMSKRKHKNALATRFTVRHLKTLLDGQEAALSSHQLNATTSTATIIRPIEEDLPKIITPPRKAVTSAKEVNANSRREEPNRSMRQLLDRQSADCTCSSTASSQTPQSATVARIASRAQSYELGGVKIGYFYVQSHPESSFRNRLRFYFSKREMVYDFELDVPPLQGHAFERRLGAILVPFESIMGLCFNEKDVLVVLSDPTMVTSTCRPFRTRLYGNESPSGEEKVDLTNGALQSTRLHKVTLRKPQASLMERHMLRFDQTLGRLLFHLLPNGGVAFSQPDHTPDEEQSLNAAIQQSLLMEQSRMGGGVLRVNMLSDSITKDALFCPEGGMAEEN